MHWGTGVLPRNGVPLWGKASDANNTNSATNEKKLKEKVSLWQVMQQVQLQLYEIKDEKMVDDGWHNVEILFFSPPCIWANSRLLQRK